MAMLRQLRYHQRDEVLTMSTKLSSSSFEWSLAVIAVTLILITSASAGTETVIFRSKNEPGTLIFDSAGNLYGMTSVGGGHNGGTVFKLSPGSDGVWTETVLHRFNPLNHKDGGNPFLSAGLVFDSAGNLYGTTTSGGEFEQGTVFELTPGSNGTWTEKILHSFGPHDSGDGEQPLSSLVFDGAGNLYGTTSTGGAGYSGTVFELSPGKEGWSEKVLHSFSPSPGDGRNPVGGVVFDKAGNLYGTTFLGGRGSGIVFELSPGSNGTWTETVLHRFKGGSDGGRPYAGLVLDKAGNLYGTAQAGIHGKGEVFALTPASGGGWTMTTIYSFIGPPGDGNLPLDALVVDATGSLYGTTYFGGANKLGTVFKLAPVSGGGWTESVLFSFPGGSNGRNPFCGVTLDPAGNLYGTAVRGIVFEIMP
jgi:uncharacterized repeat protein (TIGR03803 family)